MTSKHVRWFDLGRASAALKVIPLSPLRGVAMTVLEVRDEMAFQDAVLGAREGTSLERRARSDAWWQGMNALGFRNQPAFFNPPSESVAEGSETARGFRLFSERTSYTLADVQRIVPSISGDDYRLLPLESVLHQAEVEPGVAQLWEGFAQRVLAREAIGVWGLKADPFDKPYAVAGAPDEVAQERLKGGGHPLVSQPASRWMVAELRRAMLRENALTAFYVSRDAAVLAGHAPNELTRVDLPYALPLWVEKDGLVAALRDVRYAPELMAAEPHVYFGREALFTHGIVVDALREAASLAVAYGDEASQWTRWAAAADLVEPEVMRASIARVVEADAAWCDRHPNAVSKGLDELVAGNAQATDAPRQLRALGELSESDWLRIGVRAALFAGSPAEGAGQALVALGERWREREIAAAREAALDALKQVGVDVQSTSQGPGQLAEAPEKVRHEDAGEKIGGARKDFARRALTFDDIDAMNEAERKSLVVKKNAWPALDYAAMRDAGVTAEAAMAIKVLKDSLNVEPDRRSSSDSSGDEVAEVAYLRSIGVVRGALAEVKTLEDFNKACAALFVQGSMGPDGKATRYISGHTVLQRQWGRDACSILSDSENVRYTAAKVRSQIRRHVREGAEWAYLIKDARVVSEEEKAAAAERNEQERLLHRPHLAHVRRIGGHDFRASRDIVAADLIEQFGFRAVEFGNWLPQDERQAVLNMAFDSFCDLAQAVGLPPRAMSFDGKLAVAFGSRGTGGKSAALAHYESARVVINMTRMNGAGSLAHEWFHGLDDYLGKGRGFLTDQLARSGRPRYSGDPVLKLVQEMKSRTPTIEEYQSAAQTHTDNGRRWALGWLSAQPVESRQEHLQVMEVLFDKSRACMHKRALERLAAIPAGERDLARSPHGISGWGAVDISTQNELLSLIVEGLREASAEGKAFRKVEAKVETNLRHMLRHLGLLVTVDAARESGVTLDDRYLGAQHRIDSDYVTQATELDKKRSTPYWATTIELFARAGAQFVEHELRDQGIRSDYLVYGANDEQHVNNAWGNPNPVEADRMRFKPLFAEMIEELRLELARKAELEASPEPF